MFSMFQVLFSQKVKEGVENSGESSRASLPVIPAKAGIHVILDFRVLTFTHPHPSDFDVEKLLP
jgi:hypothetical protein